MSQRGAKYPKLDTDILPNQISVSVFVYYVAVRTIVLSRHGSNLARPVIIHDIIHGLIYVPSIPCSFKFNRRFVSNTPFIV